MELGTFIDSLHTSPALENVESLKTLGKVLAGMEDDAERRMVLTALDLDGVQGTEETSIFLRTQRNRYREPVGRLAARTDEPFVGRFAIWSLAHFAAASVQVFGCHPAHQAMREAAIHLAVGSLLDCFAGMASVPKAMGWMPRLSESPGIGNDEPFCRDAFQLTRAGGLSIFHTPEDLGQTPVATIVCSPGLDEASLVALLNDFLPRCDRFAKIVCFPADKAASRLVANEIGDFDGRLTMREKVLGRIFYDWDSRTLEVRPLRICMMEAGLPRPEIRLGRAPTPRETLGTLVGAGLPAPGVRHEMYAWGLLRQPTPAPEFVPVSRKADVAAVAQDVRTDIKPIYLSHFSHCRVAMPSAIVFSGDYVYRPSLETMTAFENFFHGLHSAGEEDRIVVSRYLHSDRAGSEFVPGRSFHALNISTHNFGHFMSEVFTKMLVLSDIGADGYDHVVVPDNFLDLARQGCEILDIDPAKLMSIGDGKVFEHLTYANCNQDSYLGTVAEGRHAARPFRLPDVEGGDRIYLSRLDASHRFIMNEQEVIDVVRSRGFEVLTGRGMGLAETIARVRKARIIVGTSGPFAQALIFKQPGSVFIELASEEFFAINQSGRWRMPTKDAWHVGLVTGTRLGTVTGPGFTWSGADEEYMRYMTNFMIRPNELREVLDRALQALG
ncbi:hypothetical protein SAE02_22110 [Skermanella aerolata]|uniref:Glycosyltransferase 61 catalytic domain-containing protein n=1 Tax=Skermanella aerolata TaxID=393310 RepID=A0A512DNJ9_9PROT|nr:glycosyltransferase family 61 protein [Skermanella aerolata]KJB95630.1 hypothetical protein N826_03880 [Skermanella aerolata KACC 11604]GEO38063.1 hypothetical protein SAE02_22110 [Skermanella aerolata]